MQRALDTGGRGECPADLLDVGGSADGALTAAQSAALLALAKEFPETLSHCYCATLSGAQQAKQSSVCYEYVAV